ncbi:MAG: DUF3226 domain-containing protein [Nitrososphaera sp.]
MAIRLILCEGQSDAAFLRHLIQERRLPDFEVKYPKEGESGGRSAFGKRLDALRAEPGFERITAVLIMSDNDDDAEASFREIRTQIQWAGYPAPEAPLQVARGNGFPAVVVLMLPGAGELGNLELLCLRAAYDRWPNLKNCLDEYCQCARTVEWPLNKQSKMRLRCLLSAVCEADPNTSLVYAWSDGKRGDLIPLDHQCFDQIAEFLRSIAAYLGQA